LPGEERFAGRPGLKVTSGKAVGAFIFGLFSLAFWIFAALPAIVLGLIAQSEVRQQRGRLKGRGLAWLGVILGVCGLFVPFLWFSWMLRALQGEASLGVLPATARIVHLHLGEGVSEQPYEDGPVFFRAPGHSLKGLLDRLDHAREDKSVKAVILTLQAPSVSLGQVEELWKAIRALVDAGKPVYAHVADVQTETYAMVSGASRINVVPTDSVWLTGMQMQAVYLGELLEKVGVDPQMMQMGDFKAAGEMFTRTGPSEAASKNMEWLLDGLYGTVVDLIAKGRKLDPDAVRALIDSGPYEAERAKAGGLIDSVMHLDQFLDEIRDTHGEDIYFDNHYLDGTKNRKGSFGTLARGSRRKAIALIYAEGMILRGYETVSPFGGGMGIAYSGDLVKTLENARDDGHIAAVVLRVDSPGGSAVASEEILRAVSEVQAEGIPVVVSMGSTAASGGYYIACKADAILADASTITASIGVVGGKMATEELWTSLGVSWHAWKRGANADLLDFVHPFTPEQRSSMEAWMGETYGAFKAHVQEGRGAKLTKPLEEMASGRVFTGAQAVELGLVDEIGGLRDAIVKAAELAKLGKGQYSLRVLPEHMTFWESFFDALRGQESDSTDLALRSTSRPGRISLGPVRIPGGAPDSTAAVLEKLAPAESRAMIRALAAAKLLGEERVIALMPELSFGH
jgi:protease-4